MTENSSTNDNSSPRDYRRRRSSNSNQTNSSRGRRSTSSFRVSFSQILGQHADDDNSNASSQDNTNDPSLRHDDDLIYHSNDENWGDCPNSEHMSQAEMGISSRLWLEGEHDNDSASELQDSFANDYNHVENTRQDGTNVSTGSCNNTTPTTTASSTSSHAHQPTYDNDMSYNLEELLKMEDSSSQPFHHHSKNTTSPQKQATIDEEEVRSSDDDASRCSDDDKAHGHKSDCCSEDDESISTIDAAELRERQVRRTLLCSILSAIGLVCIMKLITKLIERCQSSNHKEGVVDVVDVNDAEGAGAILSGTDPNSSLVAAANIDPTASSSAIAHSHSASALHMSAKFTSGQTAGMTAGAGTTMVQGGATAGTAIPPYVYLQHVTL